MKENTFRKKLLELTGNFFEAATDLLLWEIYFLAGAGGGNRNTRDLYLAAAEADQLIEQMNYQTFCRAFYQIKEKGLISLAKEAGFFRPQLSKRGEERLKDLLPVYDSQRPWDKRFYLITYDIPEQKRKERNNLRHFLQNLRAAKLQASVYLTPYNPRKKLKDFVEKNAIPGSIIVSDTGVKGSIGPDDFKTLVRQVYDLENLNRLYQEFVERYEGKNKQNYSRAQVALDFNTILKSDPQLPFELLPSDWVGTQAYNLYQKILT